MQGALYNKALSKKATGYSGDFRKKSFNRAVEQQK